MFAKALLQTMDFNTVEKFVRTVAKPDQNPVAAGLREYLADPIRQEKEKIKALGFDAIFSFGDSVGVYDQHNTNSYADFLTWQAIQLLLSYCTQYEILVSGGYAGADAKNAWRRGWEKARRIVIEFFATIEDAQGPTP